MNNIKSWEDLNRYKSIIKRIRKVYSTFTNIDEYDMSSITDNDDIILRTGFNDNDYINFIKKLEDEFEIPLLIKFWNNDPKFMDLTDDKYCTFDGIAEYTYGIEI